MISPFPSASEHACSQAEGLTDADLLGNGQAGCMGCLAILFQRYCRMMFAIAWKILRQRDEVEDLVQEVFLSILRERHRYDPSRGSVKTWISQFTHFMALSRRRMLRNREHLHWEDSLQFQELVERTSHYYKNSERVALICECLSCLNQQQRRVIEAVHYEGYTLRETAESLDQSLANTRNLYYRGLKTIRSYIQEPTVPRQEPLESKNEAVIHLLQRVSLSGNKI